MNTGEEKCVIIIAEQVPPGIAANTAAVLGVTLGAKHPAAAGAEVKDSLGRKHAGIIQIPIPILSGTSEALSALREKLYAPEYAGITVVDFTDLAQSCKTYDEFTGKMSKTPLEEIGYIGLALYGEKKKVNHLTGNMPLLR